MFLMLLGEITPGGVGAGLYGMLVFALLAVFIAGLMVGRTPEYLGKKVETFEMKMAMLVVLVLSASILGFTALAVATRRPGRPDRSTRAARLQRDPLRLRQPDRQQRLGLRRPHRQHALLQRDRRPGDAGRAVRDDHPDPGDRRLAGRQAPRRAVASGTFPTTGPIFVGLLIGVVVIVGALDLLPRPGARPDRRAASSRQAGTLPSSRDPRHRQRHAPLPALRPARRPEARAGPPKSPGILDPASLRAAVPQAVPQAGPAAPRPQPGHVRRGDHGDPGHPRSPLLRLGLASADWRRDGSLASTIQIAAWLWFTVLFATYAEAVAEARGKAQAATLRKTRSVTMAHRRDADGALSEVGSAELRAGDIVVVARGRDDPVRRRRHRGRGLRQRGRDHRRVRAGAQGAGHGHPLVGHRRHHRRLATRWSSASRPTRARPSSTG